MTLQEYFREDLIEAKEEGIAIGLSEGLERGRSEGFSAGLERGRSEGEEQKLLAQIQKKFAKGKSVEQIADEVEETVERVQELMVKMG